MFTFVYFFTGQEVTHIKHVEEVLW